MHNSADTLPKPARRRDPEATRARLIHAAIELILHQGFAATTVDQICTAAGLTKGSFFHHFPNKEALGLSALQAWGQVGTALYTPAWHDEQSDPLVAIGRFLDIMSGFTLEGSVCTCVVGMMSQETAQSNETLRAQAAHELTDWTLQTARLITDAKNRHCPAAAFEPEALAWQLNALWQGSMLVGKTVQRPEIIRANLEFARAWLAGFFPQEVRSLLEAQPRSAASPPHPPS